MKVAIGFFGITRSLKYTIDSINSNIFDVLKLNNIDYDVYIHSYDLTSTYYNPRAGEKVKDLSKIDNEEYKLLNPKYSRQDNQDEIKEKLNLKSYRTCKDPWNTKYCSVDNYILGSYSKYMLTQMIEKNIDEYDYILFMRPDCLYLDKLDIKYFKLVNDKSIVTPNYMRHGRHKINDRFAITNKKTYKMYGEIFTQLLDYSKKLPLHSETVLGNILIDKNKINIKDNQVGFKFARVRFGGTIHDIKYSRKYEKYKNCKNLNDLLKQ